MSRTVHHVPYRYTVLGRKDHELRASSGMLYWYRWWHSQLYASHVVYDLRYSAAALAARDQRPIPNKIRRSTQSWQYGYAFRGDCGDAMRQEWHAERARLRTGLRSALASIRADEDAAWDIDIPPYKHRHHALWDAW